MIKNYLNITLQHLLKDKANAGINIIGLGLAMSCCIVAYLNSTFNSDFDRNHSNIDHLYKIHSLRDNLGELIEYGRVPMPLADAIREDLTGMERVFRYEEHHFTVRDVGLGKVFDTSVCYADPGLLESFTFPLIAGRSSAYHELDKAVVTNSYAQKFYGKVNPIGKVLTIFDDKGMNFNFVISGIVQEPPQNSSIHFEVLISFENRYRMYEDQVKGNWGSAAQSTFLYLTESDQIQVFETLLEEYLPIQNKARPDFIISKFKLVPMNIHAHISEDIRGDDLRDVIPTEIIVTSQTMAILILLVACFNFTNTAISNSNRRLREIGIRKVMGCNRKQILVQFLIENLIICSLAILMSLVIASYLVPAYSALWEEVDLRLDLMKDYDLYLFLVVLLILTTALAGLYPSQYISKYLPIDILRGNLSLGRTGSLRTILLAGQYLFTVISIFASIAFMQNASYQDTIDMGYDRDQIIGVSILNEDQYHKIYASMLAHPDIRSMASAKSHISEGDYESIVKYQHNEIETKMMDVGLGYIETMGIQMVEGRAFSKDYEASDGWSSIIVNEKLVEEMGWIEPLGKQLSVNDSTRLTVIGVVKDFYPDGFWEPIEPSAFRLARLKFEDDGDYSFIIARVDLSKTSKVLEHLEQEWNDKILTKTFAGFYQDDLLEEARDVNSNVLTTFVFLGIVALVLSSLGLFTMVSLNLIKRKKEIGIRKVLGGTIGHIVLLINSRYAFLVLLSSILGVAAGYYLIERLMSSIYTYYKSIDTLTMGIPMITVFVISLTITSIKTIKSATTNPVQSLRHE